MANQANQGMHHILLYNVMYTKQKFSCKPRFNVMLEKEKKWRMTSENLK